MSYCRFTEGDVYAYESDGGVQFYVSDGRRELDRLCSTFNEAYQYARILRDTHGLDVPSHAIEALKADALEEAARILGPDSAVAELEAENAKLRELVRNFLYEHEDYFAEGNYFIGDIDLEHAMQHNHAVFRREARELGVEVDDA